MFSANCLKALSSAQSVCVLTGAGVSEESGVPTFRSAGGIWEKFKPEDFARFESFISNPELVWEWYHYRKKVIREVLPNPGHVALAHMQDLVPDFTLVTQNVDGLHARAGSRDVIELHGNITRSYCVECGLFAGEEEQAVFEKTPRCKECGGLLRPDVVWFGELLPAGALEKAMEAAHRCDVFLSVGTSGVVYPAASIPLAARNAGAYVVEINREYTDLSPRMNETIIGPSGEILPLLVTHLTQRASHEPS
ncbi:MAG: NAD-dependent protein deacylase [Bacteroidia bacterium]|nr:MAG: NAD-dependent protein deacylase [Bacteroidia bacterium]